MSLIYVYPNGDVRSSPDTSMSDDYFTVEECATPTELFDVIHKHFGITQQCIDVMQTILMRSY